MIGQYVRTKVFGLTPYFDNFCLLRFLGKWLERAEQGKVGLLLLFFFLRERPKKNSGTGPTLIHRLCPELDTWAIGTSALAGEGTHFNIISSIGPKAIQDDCRLWGSDEEFWGTARAVDVLVLQSVLHYLPVSFCQQHRLPANLNGGGGGALRFNVLRVAAWNVLVRGHFFDRFFTKAHLVARR